MNLGVIKSLCKKRAGGIKKLAADIGMTEANLHRRIKANTMEADDLEKIAKLLNINISVFFDENSDIESIIDSANTDDAKESASTPDTTRMIPLINLDVMGGFNDNIEQSAECVEKLIPWENAHEGDFAVTTSGTSMMPVIMPGSLVLLRKVEGWREFLEYNILYVLELVDLRRLLKLVQKSDSPKTLTLISYNPANPPQDISINFVKRIFKVIAIRTNYGF